MQKAEQPTTSLLAFLEEFSALRLLANQYYREIEDHYHYDKNGRVLYHAMNVPAGNKGHTGCPYQNNAYLVARTIYFAFSVINSHMTWQKSNNIAHKLKDFNSMIQSPKTQKFAAATQQIEGTYPILDKFHPNLINFIEQFNRLWEHYSAVSFIDGQIAADDLNTLFMRDIDQLIKEQKFSGPMFLESATFAKKLRKSGIDLSKSTYWDIDKLVETLPDTNSDIEDGSENNSEFELDIDAIITMQHDLCEMTSVGDFYFDRKTGKLQPSLDPRNTRVEQLGWYLAKHLPNDDLIDSFCNQGKDRHFHKVECRLAVKNARKNAVWSEQQLKFSEQEHTVIETKKPSK